MKRDELIRDLTRLADRARDQDPDTAAILSVLVRSLAAGESVARISHLALEVEARAIRARPLSA
jgi:hypothetical protein